VELHKKKIGEMMCGNPEIAQGGGCWAFRHYSWCTGDQPVVLLPAAAPIAPRRVTPHVLLHFGPDIRRISFELMLARIRLLLLPSRHSYIARSISATFNVSLHCTSSIQRRMVRYLNQREAQDIDAELMDPAQGAFTLQQLMELAGQSVACAVHKDFPPNSHPRINVICGPGNNGGDGLVCARHLSLFGYSPRVILPKSITNNYFKALALQCRSAGIPVEDGALPSAVDCSAASCDAVVDAIFGFSFSGEVREPFASTLRCLYSASVPVISVDVPSGWNVDAAGDSWSPHTLVSLTAPKLCARGFKGRHWLGGRFVPPSMATRLQLELPEYSGSDSIVLLHDKL
jgi:NAD(P)H-hydrate epimerase